MGGKEEQSSGFETLLLKHLENSGENRRPVESETRLGTAQTTAPPTHEPWLQSPNCSSMISPVVTALLE